MVYVIQVWWQLASKLSPNEENDLWSSSDTSDVIKARDSTEEEDRKCIQYLVRTLEVKSQLGWSGYRWEVNVKVSLKGTGYESLNWIVVPNRAQQFLRTSHFWRSVTVYSIHACFLLRSVCTCGTWLVRRRVGWSILKEVSEWVREIEIERETEADR